MRFYIIFGVTLVLFIIIQFYVPKRDYLISFNKDHVTLSFNETQDDYYWVVTSENDVFDVYDETDTKWKLTPKGIGDDFITAMFVNFNTSDIKYNIKYRFKYDGKKIYWMEGVGNGTYNFPNPE